MKRRRMLLAICLAAISTIAVAQDQQPAVLPAGSAGVADFKGEVTLHGPDGAVIAADRGILLTAESVIDTAKGSVLLNLQDGSQVLVKPHSHVVLKSPNQAPGDWLQLTIGNVIAKIKKRLGNSPSFRMGTPTAVITVRGTRFQVEVDKQQRTRVEVYEGVVEVRGMGVGMGGVMLQPGFRTNVRENRAPEKPERMDDNEAMPGPGGVRDGRPGAGRPGDSSRPSSDSQDHENEPN